MRSLLLVYCSHVSTEASNLNKGFTADSAEVRIQLQVDSLYVSSKYALTTEAAITASLIVLEGICVGFHVSS